MNAPASLRPESAPASEGARLSRAFVHAGIAEFARLSVGAPSAVFEALAASQGAKTSPPCSVPRLRTGEPPASHSRKPRRSCTAPSGACLPT